jgi:CBS domain-containing protein
MKVESLMRHDVRTCAPYDTLADAAQLMWEADVGALPVVDPVRGPVAMITDRDICMAAYTTGLPLHLIMVRTAMSRSLVTCKPDASLSEVEQLMQLHQIRRVPVVSGDGALMGIITISDLAVDAKSIRMPITAPGVVQTLAAVSERRWQGALAAE